MITEVLRTLPNIVKKCTSTSYFYKRFHRNIDQRSCSVCHKKFHQECLENDINNIICKTCKQSSTPNPNPVSTKRSIKELECLCHQKGLKLVHQNVRGIFGKKDEIIDILNSFSINIFGVTETVLTERIPTNFLKITGYTLERKDRPSGIGGGVGVYIKDGTPYVRRYDLEDSCLECIWLEICYPKTNGFIIGIMYKTP